MSTDAELDQYLQEARSWDADRLSQARRSSRMAWWAAAAGWSCALAGAASLVLLLPLKSVEPFLVRVDNSTGIVDIVPVYTGHAAMDEAVTRYFLVHYITVCERFNFATAESDYEECGAFQTAQRNQAWYAMWNKSNPASPLNMHKDGSVVRAQVESVSFIKRASGVSDLAQVRYAKSEQQSGGSAEKLTHWIATIQYSYGSPSKNARSRGWNPLGFKIVELTSEPEVLTSSISSDRPQSKGMRDE
ncbi:MAG TPA: type IV secretion system protein [Steroidobacteraceae bacterium]|nr:type IV secretion system protein [Steroidobacteraceae bacterium]